MAWFKDNLYVGTTRNNIALNYIAWSRVDRSHGLQVWPVPKVETGFELDLRARILRYSVQDQKWDEVYCSPMVTGRDGFKVPLCYAFRVIEQFQGLSDPTPALYIPTWATSQNPVAVLLRSIDGEHFERVSDPGLGFHDPTPRGFRAFKSFRGRLFAAPSMGQKPGEPQNPGRCVVLVTDDPLNGSWQLACEDGFEDPNNLSVYEMGVFNGFLYAGTLNPIEGFQIWKTEAKGNAPYQWTKVIEKGAYRGKLNEGACSFCVFEDHLYVGSAIQYGGHDRDYYVGPAPPEIIRLCKDDTWHLIAGEPRQTPDGLKLPLSGLGPAFGNICACYIWQMCVHEGYLYCSDAVWSPFLDFINPAQSQRDVYHILKQFARKNGGFNLWRTRDGVQWTPITRDGFGNPYNLGVRTMVSTRHGIFLGIANGFSPKVAVKRNAGWRYELNPTGGAQILLGSSGIFPDQDNMHTNGKAKKLTTAGLPLVKYNHIEKLEHEFYQGSGFRSIGFWRDDIGNAIDACEDLIKELLAFVPQKSGKALDLCCGLGSTTAYLVENTKFKSIVGLSANKNELKLCKKRYPEIKFTQMKLPKLEFPDNFFDLVFSVQWPDDRKKRLPLLLETHRVLRPHGHVVCATTIYGKAVSKFHWLRRSETDAVEPEQYQRIFERAGFIDVSIFDVTADTLIPFRQRLRQFAVQKLLNGDIDDKIYELFLNHFDFAKKHVKSILMASGRKHAIL
jgi:SAM-dependent methyltransferase